MYFHTLPQLKHIFFIHNTLCILSIPFALFIFFYMALLCFLVVIFLYPFSSFAQGPPSPGYYPSSRVPSIGFNQGFRTLWGSQHQTLDQNSLTIWLDRSSGLVLYIFSTSLSLFHMHTEYWMQHLHVSLVISKFDKDFSSAPHFWRRIG